jgi:hypothetical protein
MKDRLLIIGIVLLLSLAVVFIYISSIPITFSDDLCFYFRYTKDGNVFSIAEKMYNEKEGRFASLPGLFQISGFRYLGFNGTTVMWALFFLSSIVALALFNQDNQDLRSRAFQIMFFTVLVLISFEHILNEIVFWPTGGVYSFSIFLSLLFLLSTEYNTAYWKIIILAFLIATTGPNLTIPIMFILSIKWFYEKIQSDKNQISFSFIKLFSLLVIFVVGIVILTKSPGTIKRMNSISTYWNWHPRYIFEVVYKTIRSSFMFYPVSLPIFIFIFIKTTFQFIKGLKENRFFHQVIYTVFEVRYLIGALISVLIFVRTPGVFTERAAAFFMILLIIQFYKSFFDSLNNIYVEYVSLMLASVVLVLMINTAILYTSQYKEYHKDMKSHKITNYEFSKKHIYKDYHYFFKHYKADKRIAENIWLDQCLERYRFENFKISN